MVGAVVVRKGELAGTGFHTYDGLHHAEVLALDQAGERARGATLYLNLEPCSHAGRTPPCVERIIAAGVERVEAAMIDPNPLVSGQGVERLRAAGIQVGLGIAEQEAKKINEAFARYVRTGLPFVTLKIAMTLDGRITSPDPEERWLTSEAARAEVQQLRHRQDAILTGSGTIAADDPELTDRLPRVTHPRRRLLLRIIVDSRLSISPKARVIQTAAHDVLIFTAASPKEAYERFPGANVEIVSTGRASRVDLAAALKELGRREIMSVLVEAGARLFTAFLRSGLVDKIVLYYAPKLIGQEGTLPLIVGNFSRLAQAPTLHNVTTRQLGDEVVVEGYLRDVYRDH
jgi:diaminohydroxyphosphoribosylaminopyrimidine deaminase/5-amino-6-(5-phosphoribosylamino)uracil reductase